MGGGHVQFYKLIGDIIAIGLFNSYSTFPKLGIECLEIAAK